ncbi:unnamed protein product [Lasius platythorax]|uniref:Uncharacterized protein n=1 Tax=Lasius platythorax TaxID=488582 RepID=A0AAV2PCI5_9HYME
MDSDPNGMESVPIDKVTSDLTPSFSVFKTSSLLTTGESIDNSRLDVVRTKNSKHKIIEKKISSASTEAGNELSEGNRPESGRPSSRPLDGSNVFDFLLESNRYDRTSRGPFDVVIQAENSSSSIDPISVGRLLYSISKKDIVEIRKISFSKINFQLKSREAANNLIYHSILKTKKYKAFIPFYRTSRRGIIRNVSLDLSDKEIRRGIVVMLSYYQRRSSIEREGMIIPRLLMRPHKILL